MQLTVAQAEEARGKTVLVVFNSRTVPLEGVLINLDPVSGTLFLLAEDKLVVVFADNIDLIQVFDGPVDIECLERVGKMLDINELIQKSGVA